MMSSTLPSNQPAYPVAEVDLDGSTAKTLNFAQAIYNAVEVSPSQDTPANYAVPALRSSGLTLIHTGQAYQTFTPET
jgi:hypothetical protein